MGISKQDWPQGTEVLKETPTTPLRGVTASPVDFETGNVMILWEGDVEARTEHTDWLVLAEQSKFADGQRVFKREIVGPDSETEEAWGTISRLPDDELSTTHEFVIWDGSQMRTEEPIGALQVADGPRPTVHFDAPRMPLPLIPTLPEPEEAGTKGHFLRDWWMEAAAAEVEPMIAKMEEYGGMGRAIDLIEIGRDLHALRGLGTKVSDEEATELGIYFYMKGKMSRWTAAVMEGRRVSGDTLLDFGVYTKMAQRNRAVGGWPV